MAGGRRVFPAGVGGLRVTGPGGWSFLGKRPFQHISSQRASAYDRQCSVDDRVMRHIRLANARLFRWQQWHQFSTGQLFLVLPYPYYERALAINETVLGPQHPDTATSLWWMGGY